MVVPAAIEALVLLLSVALASATATSITPPDPSVEVAVASASEVCAVTESLPVVDNVLPLPPT